MGMVRGRPRGLDCATSGVENSVMQHPALDTLRRAINAHYLGNGREALALAEAAYKMSKERQKV